MKLKIPLAEINTWSLDDIRKVNDLLDMEQDIQAVRGEFDSQELERKFKK